MTKSTAYLLNYLQVSSIVISFHLRNNHEVHMCYPLAKRTSIYLRGDGEIVSSSALEN